MKYYVYKTPIKEKKNESDTHKYWKNYFKPSMVIELPTYQLNSNYDLVIKDYFKFYVREVKVEHYFKKQNYKADVYLTGVNLLTNMPMDIIFEIYYKHSKNLAAIEKLKDIGIRTYELKVNEYSIVDYTCLHGDEIESLNNERIRYYLDKLNNNTDIYTFYEYKEKLENVGITVSIG